MMNRAATESSVRVNEERSITLVGLVTNVLLTGLKIAVGALTGSAAIIADGLHSGSDLASDVAVLWSIRLARRPADSDHHFGHARYDNIFAVVIGVMLIIAALWVGIDSIKTIGERHAALTSWWPFWTAIASIVLKEGLYWWTRIIGRRYRNPAIIANAWHHRSDAFSSAAVAVGIAGTLIGGPRWAFLDHLTAVVLAAFLIYIGVRIVREAVHELSDRAPDEQTAAGIRKIISTIPGVVNFHAFRARRSGGIIEIDVHIHVAADITVKDGHDIATTVEKRVCAEFPDVSNVVVHIEPEA
ncbi:MAG: cation diffusion facilitator family transporter [candidate division WOR-3 bacterium]